MKFVSYGVIDAILKADGNYRAQRKDVNSLGSGKVISGNFEILKFQAIL